MGTGQAVDAGHCARRELRAFSVATCHDPVFEEWLVTRDASVLPPCPSARCRVGSRWVEGSVSEMCHLQATATFSAFLRALRNAQLLQQGGGTSQAH